MLTTYPLIETRILPDEATLKSVLGKGINWLDRATRTYAATSASSKPQRFSGATRGLLLHKPATLATKFTVAVSVRQMPNTNGYIFAQSTPSGDHASRFFSLYSSGTRGDLTVYFVNYAGATPVPSSVTFRVRVSDGKRYHVLLTFADGKFGLTVDDVHIKAVQSPVSAPIILKSCGGHAPSIGSKHCVLHVGERASSRRGQGSLDGSSYRFTGVLQQLLYFNNVVLDSYPTTC